MSPYFIKKPVVVEARQFTGAGSARDLIEWGNGAISGPYDEDREIHLEIKTMDSIARCFLGDWIIRGVAHEFYPCKQDVFGFTYEEVAIGESV